MRNNLPEEEIFVEGTDKLLKYSLSNNLNEIIHSIQSKIGCEINSNNIDWKLNTNLSISVKNLMNKHGVDYSTTNYLENDNRIIIINRCVNGQWFIAGFSVKNSQLQNQNQYSQNKTSMGTVGCILGIINLINVAIVLFNTTSIGDSVNEPMFFLITWFIITVVVAITGFFVSKSGHSKGQVGTGIAGMALNGLIILPAIIIFIGAIMESVGKARRYDIKLR